MYLRQSLDRAKGIESQRERCTALCNARGWQIIDTFRDNETEASEDRGPETGWGRMLPRIGRAFDIVVSVDLDRLARNTRDLNTLIDLGAKVVTVDGEIDLASAEGEFRGTMITAIARFETRRASERQKRHKAAKAARGEWHGGVPPYGYKLDPKTRNLVPNPAEVELIHEAATRLLERGQSLHSIIVEWNNRGERTRPSGVDENGRPKGRALRGRRFFLPNGSHWRQTGLRPILLNRSMLGETVAGVRGWEPIIDERTFDRLTALLTDPSRKVVHSPGVNGGKRTLGGGLTVCGFCGKSLIGHSKPNGKGKGTAPTLACLARVHGPSDKHPRVERVRTRNGERVTVFEDSGRVQVVHDLLEELVFERVITMLQDTERWKARMQEKSPEAENELIELEHLQRELNEQRQRAGMSYVLGVLSERESQAEVARITAKLAEVAERINALIGRPMFDAVVQEGKLENWRDWPVLDRRTFLRLFIDRIEVGPYPEGTQRTRRKLKDETEEAHKAAQWEIVKVATASRIRINGSGRRRPRNPGLAYGE